MSYVESAEYNYQPPSIIIQNVEFSYSKNNVWYWVDKAKLGSIYDIVIYDDFTVVHFNYMNNPTKSMMELHEKLNNGEIIKIYKDHESLTYWNVKKYIDENTKFDQESIHVISDFPDILFDKVTDNRIERGLNNLYNVFSPVINPAKKMFSFDEIDNSSHIEITVEPQLDMV